ncbi:DNA polymerase alpha subunit A [Giardia muris]|uniref:DNA polymerase n=1 Tax=Giardia muris TaxID=5742 RepID=A0A4Z1SSP1_GIAMU|nr:DNA polymerase alpha subunit A [Giardia muris]|eukprot:TNJ26668.1 DNA polymerase alpha subunit A [Giardia muris]
MPSDSESSGFLSEDEEAYARDALLAAENYETDLAFGGAQARSKVEEKDEAQPQVVQQTHHALTKPSKFTSIIGGLDAAAVNTTFEDLMNTANDMANLRISKSRFRSVESQPGPRLPPKAAPQQVGNAAPIQRPNPPETHAISSALATSIDISSPKELSTITEQQRPDAPLPTNSGLSISAFVSGSDSASASPQPPSISTAYDERAMLLTTGQTSETETGEVPEVLTRLLAETCATVAPNDFVINERLIQTVKDGVTPFQLGTENVPYQIYSQMLRNGALTLFCYNVEVVPSLENIALLWGKVMTEDSGYKQLVPISPYPNTMQSACVVIQGLRRYFYALPSEPIELLSTSAMSTDELNELYARLYIERPDVAFNDGIVCEDSPVLPEGAERHQTDLINVGYYEKVRSAILSALSRHCNVDPKKVRVRPVWRRYVFNVRTLPREPRVWLEVSYPANFSNVCPSMFGPHCIGVKVRPDNDSIAHDPIPDVAAIVGHTIPPLDYWLARNRISGPGWLTVVGIDWDRYITRFEAIKKGYESHRNAPPASQRRLASIITEVCKGTVSTAIHEMHVHLDGLRVGNTYIQASVGPFQMPDEKLRGSTFPLPFLSACCIQFRHIPDVIKQSGKNIARDSTLVITVTYHPGYSLQGATHEPERLTQTHVVFRRHSGRLSVTESDVQVPLGPITFSEESQASETARVAVHIKPVDTELDLYIHLASLISRYNPDILFGHNLYPNLIMALRYAHQQMSLESFLRQLVVPLSRLAQGSIRLGSQFFERFDPQQVASRLILLLKGRLLADLERGLAEFSPDARLTTVEYASSTLLRKVPLITSGVDLARKWRETTDFKGVMLPELLSEVMAVIGLMRSLNYLPLTCRISQLTALPWQSVCSLGRARRAESLIFFNFSVLPYVLPDIARSRHDVDGKRESKYTGGFVMDPVSGFYTTTVLVLDFNSLYPSIIREYSLCFTTLSPRLYHEAPSHSHPNPAQTKHSLTLKDEEDENDKDSEGDDYLEIGLAMGQTDEQIDAEVEKNCALRYTAVLPRIIGRLVTQRSAVKQEIKATVARYKHNLSAQHDATLKMLDISQTALKICANAMYGSLGYQFGRFYCPHVAARIPAKGRSELLRARRIAEELGYSVIYGDTDSIMIDTRIQYSASDAKAVQTKTRQIADLISERVREGRNYLVLGLDYVFIKYLLLQKKKYVAIRLLDNSQTKLEYKGLDLVRRDWCQLSRTISMQVLQYMMDLAPEDAPHHILSFLTQTYSTLQKVHLYSHKRLQLLSSFKMTKSITKHLSAYTLGNCYQLPHVYVARELERRGKLVRAGDVIEYIVLSEEGLRLLYERMGKTLQPRPECMSDLTYRSVPFEDYIGHLAEKQATLVLDFAWYVRNQVLPPLSRFCEYIQGLSMGQIAECFGQDSGDYDVERRVVQGSVFYPADYSAELRVRYGSCGCFVYRCPCGGRCAITVWPPPLCGYELLDAGQEAPIPNFGAPSDALRGAQAHKDGRPQYSLADFGKLRCGCDVAPNEVINSLQRQLRQYLRVFELQLTFCPNPECPLHLSPAQRRAVYPGVCKPDVRYDALRYKKYALNTLNGPGCSISDCTGDSLPLISLHDLKTQLLFFQLLFDESSQLYTHNGMVDPDYPPPQGVLQGFRLARELIDERISQNAFLRLDICADVREAFGL